MVCREEWVICREGWVWVGGKEGRRAMLGVQYEGEVCLRFVGAGGVFVRVEC